jgi:hypothetical protein
MKKDNTMEKNGMLSEDSLSDFTDEKGKVKKAEYYDEETNLVADKDNVDKLAKPVPIKKD